MRAWVLFFLALPLLRAQPNSAFSDSTILPAPTLQGRGIISDFNLDGRADFVVSEDSRLQMYLGGDSGLRKGELVPDPGVSPNIILPGDFNRDGNPDLAMIGPIPVSGSDTQQWYRWQVLKGDGAGSFTLGPQALMPEWFFAVHGNGVAEDFDLDGNLDIVIVNAAGVYLLRGNGLGSFSISGPAPRPVPQQPLFLSRTFVADMNSDTKPDIVIDWRYQVIEGSTVVESGYGITVGVNDGTGRFSYLPAVQVSGATLVGIVDFTSDNHPDFLLLVEAAYQVWKNTGNGQGAPATNISIGITASPEAASADFNLDGLMDFAVSAGPTSIAHGSDGGTFSVQVQPIGNPNIDLYSADFNGDRRPDLLLTHAPLFGGLQLTQLYLNASTRTPTVNAQVISFSRPPNQVFPGPPVALRPTSSSGLPVQVASQTPATCSVWKNTVTLTAAGTCTLRAYQPGNAHWAPGVEKRAFTIAPPNQPQTIIFPPIPDRSLAESPLILAATASSDLPVALTSSTPAKCTVSGSVVTLIADGTCTISASQNGDAVFQPAPAVIRSFQVLAKPRIDAITNAASNIPGTLAPASYAALYGANLAPSPTLSLLDAAGAQRNLEITYASATQINFLLPGGLALGAATLTVTTANGAPSFAVNIANTVPGLFSSNSSGSGLAAANVLIVNADKSVTTRLVTDGPIPVLAGTDIYLVLYGTGIRAHTTDVIAKVAGRPVEVLYAGAQGDFPGLDQINLRIPLSIGGMGTIEVQLSVDGTPSNIVTINVN